MTQTDLLQAIVAEPDDDFPRLAYADWLEERGDPRGEFIRLQFALREPDPDLRRRHEMTVREAELLAQHETDWLGRLAPLQGMCTFRRGFPDELTVDLGVFLARAKRLLAGSTIRALTFREMRDGMPQLTNGPVLEGIGRLRFSDQHLNDDDAQNLASCRFLAELTELDLTANRLSIAGARSLAASPNLPNLQRLVLDHNPIEDLGLDAVASSKHFAHLTSLGVRACDLHAGGIKSLTSTPLFGRMHKLALDGNPIGNNGLHTLSRARPPAHLTELSLSQTGINSLGLRPLMTSPVLAGLVRLDLRHNQITDGGAQSIVSSPHLGNLKHLDLRGNNLSCDARHELKVRFGPAVIY